MGGEKASVIVECLHKFRGYQSRFNIDDYEMAIGDICEFLQPEAEKLKKHTDSEESIRTACKECASQFKIELSEELDGLKRREAGLRAEEYRILLAMFIIPAMLKFGENGTTAAEEIKVAWCDLKPELPFNITSYEKLLSGFPKKIFNFIRRKE